MENTCILLDTSFFIRLLNDEDELHGNVFKFYQHFLEKECRLKCSTISVAEYCVRGEIDELPLKNLEILPFNLDHSVKAGQFANIVFANKGILDLDSRLIIPNDNKLFGQAEMDSSVEFFATSDKKCMKIYDLLRKNFSMNFKILNVREPFANVLGVLPF